MPSDEPCDNCFYPTKRSHASLSVWMVLIALALITDTLITIT